MGKGRMHTEIVAYFHKLLGTFGWNEEKISGHYRHEIEGWYG